MISQLRTHFNAVPSHLQEKVVTALGLMQGFLYSLGVHKIVNNLGGYKNSEYITSNLRRCDYDCGPGCPCIRRDNGFAGRASTSASTTASAEPNSINLNQHYDDANPYDSQFDSLRTLSGFLH